MKKKPRLLPACGTATRAQSLSTSLSVGNLTRTRPCCSLSLLFVTIPMTSWLLQSLWALVRVSSSSVSGGPPVISKCVS